ncbi:MAG: lipopolysaccharide kinase InaA family protein [Planctomycetota bacterium]
MSRSPNAGRVRARGAARDDVAAWLAAIPIDGRVSGRNAVVSGHEVVLKAGPIRRRVRSGLRSLAAGGRTPAELEFEHLTWLRKRLFRCVEPVAAVSVRRRGLPVAQLFASARVLGAEPLDAAWARAGREERRAWLDELGTELARMHALAFVHADLYPRNVLVAPRATPVGEGSLGPAAPDPGFGRALVFLDSWAGGPAPWTRLRPAPIARDLGTFLTEAADWLDAEEVGLLLGRYASARAAQGRPVDDDGRWIARVLSVRRREVARLAARPDRLRGRPLPDPDWRPPPIEAPGRAR